MISVNLATKKDRLRDWEWYNSALKYETGGAEFASMHLETHKQTFERRLREKSLFVVRYGKAKILGHAYFQFLGDKTALWSFYLNPALRGKRVNSAKHTPKYSRLFTMALLLHAKEKLKLQTVMAEVDPRNIASVKLHEFLGFEILDYVALSVRGQQRWERRL